MIVTAAGRTFELERLPRLANAGHHERDEVLDAYVVLRDQGCSLHEAAELLDKSYDHLRHVLLEARRRGDDRGRAPRRRMRTTKVYQRTEFDRQVAAWQELKGEGLTLAEAAERIGCTRSALTSTLTLARKRGIDVARTTGYVIEEWEFLREQGVDIETAARQLNTTPETIRRLAHGDQAA